MRSSRGSTISTPSDIRDASATRSAGNVLLVAAVVGVAIGVFSILADGILPGRLFTLLGNIAAPWGLAAFVVGFRATSPRRAALAGALALVVGVLTYYAGSAVRSYSVGELNVVWMVGRPGRRSGHRCVRRGDLDTEGIIRRSSRWPSPARCSWRRDSSSCTTGRSGGRTSAPSLPADRRRRGRGVDRRRVRAGVGLRAVAWRFFLPVDVMNGDMILKMPFGTISSS